MSFASLTVGDKLAIKRAIIITKALSPENVSWEAWRQSPEIYVEGYLSVISSKCFNTLSYLFKYLGFLGGQGVVRRQKKATAS